MFQSREVCIKLCRNYTKTFICKILYKIRSIKYPKGIFQIRKKNTIEFLVKSKNNILLIELQNSIKKWMKKKLICNNIHVTTYICNNIQLQDRKPRKSYDLWITLYASVELLKQKMKTSANRECRLLYLKILRTNFNHKIKTWIYFPLRNVSTFIQYPPTHIYLSQGTSYSPPGVLWALLSTVTYNWRISMRRNHAIFKAPIVKV